MQVGKWGNSLAVRLPAALVLEGVDGAYVVSPARPPCVVHPVSPGRGLRCHLRDAVVA